MDSRTGLSSSWALAKAVGPQGCQLIRWAWFGLGEKRNSDNGAAFVVPLPRVSNNQAVIIEGQEAWKALSNVSIAPLDYQLEGQSILIEGRIVELGSRRLSRC